MLVPRLGATKYKCLLDENTMLFMPLVIVVNKAEKRVLACKLLGRLKNVSMCWWLNGQRAPWTT